MRLLREESSKWPQGVSYRVLGDQSKMIADIVADLENGILTALILVVGVIMCFMGVRSSLFVALAIPLSFLLGILVIAFAGITLNMVVLFSLILVLGMLVDNAIVIVENIYRHAEMGKKMPQAAIEGAREVATAVAASTVTTVAAFLPLVFWTGIMGKFMGYMPKTVVIVLIASLVVAVAVLPVATSKLLRVRARRMPKGDVAGGAAGAEADAGAGTEAADAGNGPSRDAQAADTGHDQLAARDDGADGNGTQPKPSGTYQEFNKQAGIAQAYVFSDSGYGTIMTWYRRMLRASIRRRYLALFLGVLSLIGSIFAYAHWNHGTEFFPETDPNRAIIMVRAADGTDLEATDAIVRQVETLLAAEENVDVYVAEVGVSGSGQDPTTAGASASHSARITVDFLPDESSARTNDKVRVEPTPITVERIRQALIDIPGAAISVEKENMGPPVGAPIAVEVSGDDFHRVGEYAAVVRRQLSDIPGTAKLTDNYRVGRPELRLRIDRAAAKRIGASTQEVAGTVRTAIAGTEASVIRDGEDEYDIVVELDPRYKDDLQSILAMRIPGRLDTSPDTFPVPLSAVAGYELVGGSGAIRHIDQELVVTIEGQIAEGFNENAVRNQVIAWLEQAQPPEGLNLRLGGANDEQREAEAFLSRAFIIAIFLIALVLVTQFNGFDIPFIILASVILSLIGVLWGLMITGTAFGVIMTGLGVISLAGVVVNNAIVLLDYVEQLRARGLSMMAAVMEAGCARFRPVMLTAITTILGLVPMALGISISFSDLTITTGTQTTQWWGPMAVAVIFGLGFATLLTLVLVPTMYSIIEDLRILWRRVMGAITAK